MNKQLRNLLLVLCSILITIFIVPLFFLFLIFPLILYRKVIIFLASWKNEIYLPLNICSGSFGWDDMHGKPTCTLCMVSYLKDGHGINHVIRKLEGVVKIHPELSCTLYSWMSILFWKRSPIFQLSQHVTINEESDQEKIQQYLDSLPDKPFSKGMPLWECISLPNYSNSKYHTKSAIVWRLHHTLGDALAFFSLLNDFFDNNDSGKEIKYRENFKNLSPSRWTWNIWTFLQLIFVTPTEAVFTLLKGFDSNPLTIKVSERSGEMVRCQNPTAMDVANLKRISRRAGTNMTAILFAGVAGALKRIMKKRGGNLSKDVTSLYMLPNFYKHPGTMMNNLLVAALRMPLSEENLNQRLVQISNQFHHLYNTTGFVGCAAIYRAMGVLSGTLRKYCFFPTYGTIVHSNMSTFKENRFELFGNPVEQIAFISGLNYGSGSIFLATISYNGKMGIAITADKALFPGKDELDNVTNDIIREINEISEISFQKEVEVSLV